jgi:NAD(P)-dependent dehydrogenase (short-subunit alcohol dehydrogenase family)
MQSVVITGAATGMGLEMADIFAGEGWQVFAAVLPGQNIDELTSRNATIKVLRVDIANAQLCQEGARQVAEIVGSNGLDLLINNAGVGSPGQGILESLDITDTRKLFEINVFGTMQITQALLPLLTKSGNAGIINFASGVVRVPLPFSLSYNMSKYARRYCGRNGRSLFIGSLMGLCTLGIDRHSGALNVGFWRFGVQQHRGALGRWIAAAFLPSEFRRIHVGPAFDRPG